MALQDQVKELTDTIGTIEENTANLGQATSLIGDDVKALKDELVIANERSNVDLSGLIARASNIGSAIGEVNTKLREIAGPNAGSDPESQPTPTEGETSTGVITGDER